MLTLIAPVDVVVAPGECWACSGVTPVSSLRVQAVVDDDGHRVDGVRLTNAQELPQEVVKAVQRVNPHFREGFSKTAEITYWANHCCHCGALQGDFFLNSEPDGPFFGGRVPEGSTTVRLFDAGEWPAEAGYSY